MDLLIYTLVKIPVIRIFFIMAFSSINIVVERLYIFGHLFIIYEESRNKFIIVILII